MYIYASFLLGRFNDLHYSKRGAVSTVTARRYEGTGGAAYALDLHNTAKGWRKVYEKPEELRWYKPSTYPDHIPLDDIMEGI